MIPLEILIGGSVGLSLAARANHLFDAVFDSRGVGTLIYIAALDIIKTQFEGTRPPDAEIGFAAVGFGIIAVLALWI